MAERNVGLKVEVKGEQEYKRAIAELNKGNQVLNSEMKLLQERYKDNEGSMEALRDKSDLLQRQLQQQKDKVQTLRDALKNAANEYGEADKRTQAWQIQLNNAERDQIKLERALEETNNQITAQGEATEEDTQKISTLGDQVSGLAEKFGVHLPESVKSALDNVDGFSTGTVVAMGAAVAGIAAVELAIKAVGAGIEAVQKLNEITLEQGKWADDLLTRSSQTGLGTSLLQQLDYASKFLDFDGIDKSLVKLTSSMDAARDGAEKQSAAFQALGVTVTGTDGQLRDNWDTFKDVIDALGTVENATERDALANDIFGRSYAELKPLIDAGSEGLQQFMDRANETGSVLDEEQVKKLGEVNDAYDEYNNQIENVKKKLAVEFAPVATQVMGEFGDFISSVGDKLVESGIVDKLGDFTEPLGKILSVVLEMADKALPALEGPLNLAAQGFSALADGIEAVWNYASQFFDWLAEKDAQWQLNDSVGYYADGYNPALPGNAAGTANWRGGLTWVGESGPELVSLPQGTRIYNNQESERISAAVTDTSRMEALLSRSIALQERIASELQWLPIRGRMA